MAREESLILEIVWNDNLWRGACKDPLGNSNCTGEAFEIWYPDKGDVEKINARKPYECGDPSVPGRCAESAIFSQWEYLRWPKTAPAPNRMPRYIFFVSEQPGGSHAQGHFLRGFYTVTGIEKRDEGARAVLGDPNASSWFHPSVEIKLEDYTEPVNFMVSKGKYISHNVGENLAEKWLREELEWHRTLVEEYAGDEEARKEIKMIISRIEQALMASNIEPPEEPSIALLRKYFISQGLHFTPAQLATFYTALKTKGFVILTGISGTGKTKLAQYFAELLGSKDQFHFAAVRPDWRDSKSLLGYFNPLLGQEGQFQSTEFLGFILEATEQYLGSGDSKREDILALVEKLVEFDSPLTRADLPEEVRELVQRQPGIQKISRETFAKILDLAAAADRFDLSRVTQTFLLRLHEVSPYADEPRKQYHFRMGIPGSRQLSDPLSKGEKVAFVYYSPDRSLWAAGTFDRMERQESGASPHVPYFVLLDEMNLAKVEYYFADFLSVLESGRDDDGFTKEAIRFQYSEGIDGPPRELCLPPNLYFIGTVNVDETTYMFSPKVLDRAFTLELATVNLQDYPGEQGEPLSDEMLEQLRAQLLPDFTRQGQFAVVDKTRVAEFAATHGIYRQHLSTLNALLQPYDLHFGYRVFDEIMMFLANAEGSPVSGGFGPDGLDAAFDAAVLMKVLPKFHGTRGKLREPLEKMVWWAREPNNPEAGRQALPDRLQDTEKIASLKEGLRKLIEGGTTEETSADSAFTYPRTALKALRMLHDLHTTGFASFA
jgi:5-methylcytosine-specific restriction protein B